MAKKKTIDMYPAYVYKNLHNHLWSIEIHNKVVGHTDYIRLEDCEFVVHPSGKLLAQKSGSRNVHAYVKGWVVELGEYKSKDGEGVNLTVPRFPLTCPETKIDYNPFNDKGFYKILTGEEVQKADVVEMYFQNKKSRVLMSDDSV